MRVELQALIGDDYGWGTERGRKAFNQLREVVEDNSAELVFTISLRGIKQMDASFSRESVIALAKNFRGRYGFCITNVEDKDILANWEHGANRLEQPIIAWAGNQPTIIGPQPGPGVQEMLKYVFSVPVARTNEAAAILELKVPNASNKLKQLWEAGYIFRRERAGASGGIEFDYFAIREPVPEK
jgi:hypothetical protein